MNGGGAMQIEQAPATPRERWRVLLVDDDPWMLRIMRASLASFARVVTCPSAAEALRALEEEPFDVVCTDLVMPGMNGVELLASIERAHARVGRLLVTGAEEQIPPEDRTRHDVLRKPFDPSKFASIVARLASAAAAWPEPPRETSKLAAQGGDR